MLAAVIQLTSTEDVGANLERAGRFIERAAGLGAGLVALPEMTPYMREEGSSPHPAAEPLEGPYLDFLRDRAKRFEMVIAGGSFPEAIPGEGRVHNTSVVIDADGRVAGVYRKVHLFAVSLPGVVLDESRGVVAGEELVVAETRAGVLGLSVCYDLRFPELYRELARRGATVLLVPSAFTVPTGSDHWEVLLRARAIENQAYVIAAAQYGAHGAKRRSYGRSLIIDPWGLVLATAPDGEGLALAALDAARVADVRERLPALRHRRLR